MIFKRNIELQKSIPNTIYTNLAKRYYIHKPDLTILDEDEKIWFVIEQDGRIHETDEKMKKDVKRNQLYRRFKIPLIILNSSKIKSQRKAWYKELDDQMEQKELVDSDD